MNMISSCSILMQGAVGSFGMTTYTATPENMQDVESMYAAMEEELREKMEDYEDFTPGYDEYDITGEVLGHDPFVLASILSAVYGEYTPEDAERGRCFTLNFLKVQTGRAFSHWRSAGYS